jgi:hypothetical protein
VSRHQTLGYTPDGILWLNSWHDTPGAMITSASIPIGHINNPRTGFHVPEGLGCQWDELVAEWAMMVVSERFRKKEGRP